MQAFSHFLFRTRSKLISWKASGLNDLDSAINRTEDLIQNLESNELDNNSFNNLMELYAKLSSLQSQSSSKWAQKVHLRWVKDGDRCTQFFHSINRYRVHTNYISQIMDLNENTFCDPSAIDQVFISYYQHLWSAP